MLTWLHRTTPVRHPMVTWRLECRRRRRYSTVIAHTGGRGSMTTWPLAPLLPHSGWLDAHTGNGVRIGSLYTKGTKLHYKSDGSNGGFGKEMVKSCYMTGEEVRPRRSHAWSAVARWEREEKNKKLRFLMCAPRFYVVGGILRAGWHILLHLEFKLGWIFLTDPILSWAQPKWMKFGEIWPFGPNENDYFYREEGVLQYSQEIRSSKSAGDTRHDSNGTDMRLATWKPECWTPTFSRDWLLFI